MTCGSLLFMYCAVLSETFLLADAMYERRYFRPTDNIILISQPKHTLWILKRTSSLEYPKQMFKRMDEKFLTILRPKFVFIWRPEIRTKKDN